MLPEDIHKVHSKALRVMRGVGFLKLLIEHPDLLDHSPDEHPFYAQLHAGQERLLYDFVTWAVAVQYRPTDPRGQHDFIARIRRRQLLLSPAFREDAVQWRTRAIIKATLTNPDFPILPAERRDEIFGHIAFVEKLARLSYEVTGEAIEMGLAEPPWSATSPPDWRG